MDAKNTINSWKENIRNSLSNENFIDLTNSINQTCISVINDDFISLFSNILKGNTFTFGELENSTFNSNSFNDYLTKTNVPNIIFSNLNKNKQQEILDKIISKNNQVLEANSYSLTYLTFGIINYTINNQKLQAPLVFLPIKLIQSPNDKHYKIQSLNKEIYLNYPLIDLIKKSKKIDISYPVNQDFTLSEYLYYISIKVKNINWFINNQCFIGNFDFSYYFDLLNIKNHEEEISQNQLVKKIAYFNSEFFQLNNKEQIPLDNKFLSLLNIESEEYQLLKTIAKRDNLLIRCDQKSNKYHFISNIILSYLLNNKKVLILYSSSNDKIELIKEINKNSYSQFALDLSLLSSKKDDILSSLASYENFTLPYNSLHPIALDEDVTSYYDLKNKFQSLINSLRTTKNPLKTSINKLINSYYSLDKYPLIDAHFKESRKFDLDILQQYLQLVKEFSNSIEGLNCPLKEHPFYGFNKKEMYKKDYLPLKSKIISLSESIKDGIEVINQGVNKYDLPNVHNLKEMKALLNILSFISYYKNYDTNWIKEENLDDIYDKEKISFNKLNQLRNNYEELISSYPSQVRNLNLEELENLNKTTNNKKILKHIHKKYFKKKIPLCEVNYISNKIYENLNEQKNIDEYISKLGQSYKNFILNNSLSEFREVINNINIYKYNIRFLNYPDNFDVIYQIKNTNIASSKHRQIMQIVFNLILDGSKYLQEYFDPSIVLFESMELNEYFTKVDKMASYFISINQYLEYYVLLNKLNSHIASLGNALVEYGDYKNFDKVFLKRFYYDLLNSNFNNKDIFSLLNRKDIFSLLDSFKDSDNNRKNLIEKIINNNINKNTTLTISEIKNTEGKQIKKLLSEDKLLINLDQICSLFKKSISSFKPCILSSYKDISKYLNNNEFNFDVTIVLSNRDMEVKDIISSLPSTKQLLIFDQQPLTKDIRSTLINTANPNSLVKEAKTAFKEIRYTQQSHSIYSSMENNLYDLDFKSYLMNKLQKQGFDVGINRPIKDHIIDILVKVKNSPYSIAIMVDHFPYYSPEEASETFFYQEKFLKDIGYFPYRIFTSLYFIDEENEFNALVEYIVNQSKLIPEIEHKKNNILLMDYLFPLFKDPRQIYYSLSTISNLNDKLKDFIEMTSPISLEEIRIIFKENIEENLIELEKNNFIEINDNFIYIPNKIVKFRRVNRDEDFYRPLNSVSEKEIYDAIYEILDYKSTLNKDTLIKMILLSLGYKKANPIKYKYIEDKIDYLLEQKVIFIENNTLYRNI